MFEIIEHTADIGFRARGRTLAQLFENAATALVSVALELEDIAPERSYVLAAQGEDYESLLVNWLSEALYLIDGQRLALRRFEVDKLSPTDISGKGFGEPRDPERHRAKLVVKGVTYHQLEIREGPDGWSARVFLDI